MQTNVKTYKYKLYICIVIYITFILVILHFKVQFLTFLITRLFFIKYLLQSRKEKRNSVCSHVSQIPWELIAIIAEVVIAKSHIVLRCYILRVHIQVMRMMRNVVRRRDYLVARQVKPGSVKGYLVRNAL